MLVNEIFIGFKGHPGGSSLLLTAHGVITKKVHGMESCSCYPVMQAGSRRDEPGARNLGVGVLRKQGYRFGSRNGLGFYYQRSPRFERAMEVSQGFQRRRSMVEDPEAENDIKTFRKQIEMLDTEQLRLKAGLSGKGIEGVEGIMMLDIGLESQNKIWLIIDHAKHIISIIAANIGDDLSRNFRQFWNDAIPFFFASPFGVDIDSKYRKWPFSPGHESAKHFVDQ